MNAPDAAAPLILVDGSSYLYRAFHALPPLTNSRGEPTGAVYGVLNMLQRFIRENDRSRLVVVFDAPGKTFRDELFTEYKAQRAPMPDDLRSQIEPLLACVKALGWPLLRIPGVEADDVIGTLACRAAKAGEKVIISTGDKDMAQLVDPQGAITLVNTMTNTRLDREGVKVKFDVWPEQIIDYLSLVGDSSDNIPGIDKVGPKTAAKWLAQYGSLAELVKNADAVTGKVGENLRAGLATLDLAQKLATIKLDVELPAALDLERSPPDMGALRELYSRLEFKAWLRALDGESPPADKPGAEGGAREPASDALAGLPPPPEGVADRELGALPRHYRTVLDAAGLDELVAALKSAPLLSLDTETTSIAYREARIVGLSFAVSPGEAWYVPLGHDYAGAPPQLDRAATLATLKPFIEDAKRPKLGHHLKYDVHVLAHEGIALAGQRYDSMLESYVLDSVAIRHDMDSCADRYLGVTTIKYEEVAGKGAKQIPFSQVSVESATAYAAEDADITLRLHQTLWQRLEKEPKLRKLYEEIEQPLVPVLTRMESFGVLVDAALLRTQSGELAKRMLEIAAEAHAAAGGEFNLESPKQLQQILFERLQIPVLRKTPTGQPSTAEDVLEELAGSHALPRLILDYRGMAKLKSTYTDKLPLQIDPASSRIHTSYHQAVAATGRLSSTDPNLQNIPIRTAEGRRIRQAFIAPPGHVLIAADYSQIELRIMAHLSGDADLLKAFAADLDIHQATASEVFGVPLEKCRATSAARRRRSTSD